VGAAGPGDNCRPRIAQAEGGGLRCVGGRPAAVSGGTGRQGRLIPLDAAAVAGAGFGPITVELVPNVCGHGHVPRPHGSARGGEGRSRPTQ